LGADYEVLGGPVGEGAAVIDDEGRLVLMAPRNLVLGLAALVTGVIGMSSAAATDRGTPIRVRSSLDAAKVLPLRTRWLAYPSVSPSKIKEVDFLIDGKLRWIERYSPYNYGSDDSHGHLGFLITTWLTPGVHRFTARAVPYAGRTASHTSVARVLPAPTPPAELAGTWTRNVTAEDVAKATSGEGPLPGVWKLVFDGVGAWVLDPLGSGVVEQYEATPTGIHAYAPIQMAPFSDGKGGIARFGHRGIGGTVCNYDGPSGSWTWLVSGDQLTLTPIKEACGDRRAIWEGTWTRVT
jgi:hypothetical protein